MSDARGEMAAPEAGASVAVGTASMGWGTLLDRVEQATGSWAAAARVRAGRFAGALRGGALRRSPPLRHGLAAWARGNHEAALALLREAVARAPAESEPVLSLWNLALLCERPEEAAPALAGWIRSEATAGRSGVALAFWSELAERAPDQLVDAPTLVRLLPELRRAVASAPDEAARRSAEAQLRRALRQAVSPGAPRLTPGLALRILEEARFVDGDVARRAGAIALAAPDLHASKRRTVEHLLARLRPAGSPAERPGPERDVVGVQPLELRGDGLTVLEGESGLRTRIDLRTVEALAVARVGGPDQAGLVVDLVLRASPGARLRKVFRMLPEAFDAGEVLSDRPPADDPLRALLGALLDRSGAVPLPDPDSALGIEPSRFGSLAEYERSVLSRLSPR